MLWYIDRNQRTDQAFVGYHQDTPAAVVMHVTNHMMHKERGDDIWEQEVSARLVNMVMFIMAIGLYIQYLKGVRICLLLSIDLF